MSPFRNAWLWPRTAGALGVYEGIMPTDKLDGHRGGAVPAPVGRPDHLDVAPQVRVVGVVRHELADHPPGLAVELERRADVDARELLARALADDQFAQSRA